MSPFLAQAYHTRQLCDDNTARAIYEQKRGSPLSGTRTKIGERGKVMR